MDCGLDLLRDREVSSLSRIFFLATAISVLAIPARSRHSNPRLGCNVFVLLSRSMLRSLPFRSLNAARSPRSHSLEGFSPTLLEQFPLQQPGLCCPSPVSRPPCRTRAARAFYVRVRRLMCRLLASQRNSRINTGRAPSGTGNRHRAGEGQHDRHTRECHRVQWLYTEQHGGKQPS